MVGTAVSPTRIEFYANIAHKDSIARSGRLAQTLERQPAARRAAAATLPPLAAARRRRCNAESRDAAEAPRLCGPRPFLAAAVSGGLFHATICSRAQRRTRPPLCAFAAAVATGGLPRRQRLARVARGAGASAVRLRHGHSACVAAARLPHRRVCVRRRARLIRQPQALHAAAQLRCPVSRLCLVGNAAVGTFCAAAAAVLLLLSLLACRRRLHRHTARIGRWLLHSRRCRRRLDGRSWQAGLQQRAHHLEGAAGVVQRRPQPPYSQDRDTA